MQQTCINSPGPPPLLSPEETVTNQIMLGRLPRKGAISLGLEDDYKFSRKTKEERAA